MGRALSGAEREERAGERLAEARQQLAAIQARMAASQGILDSLAKLEQSAQANVTAAQKALDAAAERVVDAHAQVLVAVGSDDEAELTQAHGEAVDARKAARQQLDEARRALEQTRKKIAAESATIRAQMAQDDETRGEVSRIIQSLERAQQKAHHDAGLDRLAAAREKYAAIYARIGEHTQALADAESDLDAYDCEVRAIGAAHPELAQSPEYAEVADDKRMMREILSSYAAYLGSLAKWHSHPHAPIQQFYRPVLAETLTQPLLADPEVLLRLVSGSPQSAATFVARLKRDIELKIATL